uniref:Uncharacterized protein n=1 Tax=uncultured marine bacterium MedDCM-OCT-S04-C72 TaxID=743060 RepID=D6PGK2_9BACT|nr:hypothetical protein [uncultured marine bacterium MedDCM-OCT-S04-C72]
MNSYIQFASSGERSKLNRRIATSASQLKHAQLSGGTLTCECLNVTKQPWHTATDSIDSTQTLKGSIMLGWIEPRLIHNFGPPITLHRGPAQRHVLSRCFYKLGRTLPAALNEGLPITDAQRDGPV